MGQDLQKIVNQSISSIFSSIDQMTSLEIVSFFQSWKALSIPFRQLTHVHWESMMNTFILNHHNDRTIETLAKIMLNLNISWHPLPIEYQNSFCKVLETYHGRANSFTVDEVITLLDM